MKAVLALRGLEIPRTHDLVLLLRLVETGEDRPPEQLEEAKSLAPWAVALRYDEMDSTLDRASALATVVVALSGAEVIVETARTQPPPGGT
jgi:HEPN domain-containing protein